MKHIFSKKNRALLSELVRTDFKLRYQNSALGYAWSLLRPLLLFFILYIVFVRFLKLGTDVPHYPIYLLLGIVIWNFFYEMTTQSLSSIVGRGDLIRKTKIPRWIIVVSTSISATINLSLNLLVVAVFMYFNDVDLMRTALWLPFILFEVYVLALGASLFLSAAYVKYRDISYIWEVGLQAMFYLVPILYPLTLIPNVQIQKILLINPIAQAIQDARYVLVTHDTITVWRLYDNDLYAFIPFILVIVTAVIGVTYFRKESKYFAENI